MHAHAHTYFGEIKVIIRAPGLKMLYLQYLHFSKVYMSMIYKCVCLYVQFTHVSVFTCVCSCICVYVCVFAHVYP